MRQKLSLTMNFPQGDFEILAISAGEGNGWQFDAGVLERSLPLWDGVQCFVDHAPAGGSRSVRDLAGTFSRPSWDAARQGIRLVLRTFGPGGPLVQALGRELLAQASPEQGGVGFSADLSFTAGGRQVSEIRRVYSLDVVVHPARGGAFLRALDGSAPAIESDLIESQGETMQQEDTTSNDEVRALMQEPLTDSGDENRSPSQSRGVRESLDCRVDQTRPSTPYGSLQGQASSGSGPSTPPYSRSGSEVSEMQTLLLETSLAASRLPAAAQNFVRASLAGRPFEPQTVSRAIEDARALVSALTGAASVHNPRITGMVDSRDQLQCAVDDLFGAPRQAGLESVRAARLSGIRELYLTLTGDYDLHGGYYPERARFATTADFSGLVKNALNKVVANRWGELGRAGYNWWEALVTVEHFDTLNQITGTLVGTVGSLPAVAEGAAYTELPVGDSPEVASFTKYGGYIPLTLELIDRDETRKLRAYPRELAAAGLRKISSLVAGIFTAASGVGPNMADGGALFNTTAVTTAGGHANLGTVALTSQSWEDACVAVYNQPMLVKNAAGQYGAGPRMGVNPRYLLAPRALQLAAMRILYPTIERAANIYAENMQRGQPGDVITVPEWTDYNNWAAACDPLVAPALFLGERFGLMPEIFIAGDELSPAVFTNDEHRLKVRHFLAVWVNDFRPLYKANVVD